LASLREEESLAKPCLAIHAGLSFAPDFQLKGETAKRRLRALDLKIRRENNPGKGCKVICVRRT
jgi:hypothetical protein